MSPNNNILFTSSIMIHVIVTLVLNQKQYNCYAGMLLKAPFILMSFGEVVVCMSNLTVFKRSLALVLMAVQ